MSVTFQWPVPELHTFTRAEACTSLTRHIPPFSLPVVLYVFLTPYHIRPLVMSDHPSYTLGRPHFWLPVVPSLWNHLSLRESVKLPMWHTSAYLLTLLGSTPSITMQGALIKTGCTSPKPAKTFFFSVHLPGGNNYVIILFPLCRAC